MKHKDTDGKGKKEGPSKQYTWRRVAEAHSHRYGTIIYEKAGDPTRTKIITTFRRNGRHYIVRIVYYVNGAEHHTMNFTNVNTVLDDIQRN